MSELTVDAAESATIEDVLRNSPEWWAWVARHRLHACFDCPRPIPLSEVRCSDCEGRAK